MPLGTNETESTSTGVVVRSGLNRINLPAGDSVEVVYNRCKSVLNMDGTDNLTVVVDGETYAYTEVRNAELLEGSVVEFVKSSGSKGL